MLAHSTLFAAIASALTCSACSGDDRVYLMQRAYLVDVDGNESDLGGGCESVGGDASGVTGLANERFSIIHSHESDGVRITIRDRTSFVLEERFYVVDFLASGMEEDFAVELSDGSILHLRYWGSQDCIPPDAGE